MRILLIIVVSFFIGFPAAKSDNLQFDRLFKALDRAYFAYQFFDHPDPKVANGAVLTELKYLVFKSRSSQVHLAALNKAKDHAPELAQGQKFLELISSAEAWNEAISTMQAGALYEEAHSLFIDYETFVVGYFKSLGGDKASLKPYLAYEILRLAAELGHHQAQFELATNQNNISSFGLRSREDLLVAASEGGHLSSQLALARAYVTGEFDVERNLGLALYWYEEANDNGAGYPELNQAFLKAIEADLKQTLTNSR